MLRSIVEMMKKAAKFLSYPIVQYIPITIRTLAQSGNWGNPFNQPSPHIYLFEDMAAFKHMLERFQIRLTSVPPEGNMYVICINFHAELGLFRFLTCKIIGTSTVNSYHVFSITKKYFPRRAIHFVLYDDTGRKLKTVNYDFS